MIRKLSISAAMVAVLSITSVSMVHAQYGGVQVQLGGYGTGVRIGTSGYGNAYYGGYRNGYGNGYVNPGYAYYGNGYGGYSNGGYYNNGYGNGYYRTPLYGSGYVVPRYYAAPIQSYPYRRYRYR